MLKMKAALFVLLISAVLVYAADLQESTKQETATLNALLNKPETPKTPPSSEQKQKRDLERSQLFFEGLMKMQMEVPQDQAEILKKNIKGAFDLLQKLSSEQDSTTESSSDEQNG